ncbi:hypothetical protein GCM10028795_27090 [Lysobacter olei]
MAGSQERRDASASSYAWIVNFNNGNANNNHRDNNNAFVRAVRSLPAGECHGARAGGDPARFIRCLAPCGAGQGSQP